MFDFADAIQSVGEAFKSLTNYLKQSKVQQAETEIIKENKRRLKALNIAEDILLYIDKFQTRFTPDEWIKYVKLKEKFYDAS